MPYVCTNNNKYIGEHDCGKYHYGNMSLVRECCVKNAIELKELVGKKAITREHPAARMFIDAWNELTDAEMELVGVTLINMFGEVIY